MSHTCPVAQSWPGERTRPAWGRRRPADASRVFGETPRTACQPSPSLRLGPPATHCRAEARRAKAGETQALPGAISRLSLLAILLAASARAEIQIERVFLPQQAAPSSFAIGLPGGVNVCFDPVRGGVNYAWTGGFLDLTPARPGPGKFISAAKLLGPIVYQETGVAPLRHGDPARVPVIEFTGYVLRAEAIEFRYTVDGTPVREEIRARAGGTGLIRRFTFAGGTDTKWWHVAEGRPPAELPRETGGTFVLEIVFAKEAK